MPFRRVELKIYAPLIMSKLAWDYLLEDLPILCPEWGPFLCE
jgi:hypothetical protein